MSVGKIEYATKQMRFENIADLIEAAINLEKQGIPMTITVFSHDKLELSSELTTVRYLQEMIPEDAEKDRFWIGSEAMTAVYYNPNGGPEGLGDWEHHIFRYDYILKMDAEYSDDENGDKFFDALYGDAVQCPTYCTDIDTEQFEVMLDEWSNGYRPEDTSNAGIRKWMVETALNAQTTRKYKIPVEWAMSGSIIIEASSPTEAIALAREQLHELQLPEGYYIDGSFVINSDHGQSDEKLAKELMNYGILDVN